MNINLCAQKKGNRERKTANVIPENLIKNFAETVKNPLFRNRREKGARIQKNSQVSTQKKQERKI